MHSFDMHLGLALGAAILQNGQQHLLVHFVDLQFSGLILRSLLVKLHRGHGHGQVFRFNSNFVDNLKCPKTLRSEQASQNCVLFKFHLYLLLDQYIIVMDYSCKSLFLKPKLSTLRLLILCIERLLCSCIQSIEA